MSKAGQPAANKGLLMAFVIVLLAGAAYLAYTNMQSGEDDVPGIVKAPDNIQPVSPEQMANGPQPQGYGGGR
jgi:hypothetical protein